MESIRGVLSGHEFEQGDGTLNVVQVFLRLAS